MSLGGALEGIEAPLVAELTVDACNDVPNGTKLAQPLEGESFTFTLPACAKARLTLRLYASEVLTFVSTAVDVGLPPGTDVNATFRGRLHGELVVDSDVATTCEARIGSTLVATMNTGEPIALPVTDYDIVCKSPKGENVAFSARPTAAERRRIPLTFLEPDAITELAVRAIGGTTATASWSTNATGARTVEVTTLTGTTSTTTTANEVMLTGLSPGTEHTLRVTAGTAAATINFTTFSAEDALLTALTVDGVTPANFSPQTTSLTVTVPATTSMVDVQATAESAGAMVSGTGMTALFGVDTVVEIIVTAEAGNTQTYTLTIHRDPQDLAAGYAFVGGFIEGTTLYVPVTNGQISVTSLCMSNCPSFSATYDGAPYTLGDLVAPVHGAVLQITALDAVTGMQDVRTYTTVRNILLSLVPRDDWNNSNLPLSPAFGTTTTTYTVGPTISAGIVPVMTNTANTSLVPATGTYHGLVPGLNVLSVQTRTLGNAAVDTYSLQVQHERLMVVNYDATNDRFSAGYARPAPNFVWPGTITNTAAPGLPITTFKQRPNTRYVYAIHNDGGSSVDGISVVSVALTAPGGPTSPGHSLTFRDRGGGVTVLDVFDGFDPDDLVFHPTLPIFYAWASNGLIYKVPLTGTFIDGADAGQVGLPQTPVSQNTADPFGAAGVRRLLIAPDGSKLYAVNFSTGGSVRAMTLDANGDASAFAAADTVTAGNDAALSIDGNALYVATATGIGRYPVAPGTGAVGAIAGTDAVGATTRLRMHPALRVMYATVSSTTQARTYGPGAAAAVGSGFGSVVSGTEIAMDWAGRQIYTRTAGTYGLNAIDQSTGGILGGGGDSAPVGTTNSGLWLFTQ